ncbi:hypothetical protein [uncultured Psychroserpens sp.]|uniref:hypothetical protein n=1 Tax=uncultured Psychroserpens sp. TaxID=255436 RepID=UPI0026367B06|nr:hypothetical protein [uncultured Psychroserpens sp.]
MKNFKLFLLSFALIASVFTSCTNDEPVIEDQNIDESASITTSLSELRLQFNNQGNMIPTENPTGNIVFDFCFDFVYPINLSYNNGTTVAVESLEDLVQVLINSTDDLYINGIAFPFDVETYNDDSDAIEVVTINNEEEFEDVLEDCDFDEFDCECDDEYDPVCVEIEAPNGEVFLMTYPNECYAECDGFTEDDFSENCEEDYNCPGGIECFTFNFPLSIITDDGTTLEVNSQEELDNALYNSYYFDFVFPIDVTLDDGDVLTINNEEEFEDILEDCFDEYDDDCEECANTDGPVVCVEYEEDGQTIIIPFPNACYAECEGFTQEDFVDCGNTGSECLECLEEEIDPVCVEYEENGQVFVTSFPNACYAECAGFSSEDFIECEDINNPSDCSEEDVEGLLVECQFWTVTIGDQEYTYVFGSDGTVTVSEANDPITSGTWEVSTTPVGGEVGVTVNTDSGNFASVWLFFDCDNPEGPEVVSTASWVLDITSGCE